MLSGKIFALLGVGFMVAFTGDYLTKRWTQGAGRQFLVAAWTCYFFMSGIWFLVINERSELGRVGLIWSVVCILAAIAMGFFVFGETLTLTNKVGVLLCILGVVLTSL